MFIALTLADNVNFKKFIFFAALVDLGCKWAALVAILADEQAGRFGLLANLIWHLEQENQLLAGLGERSFIL